MQSTRLDLNVSYGFWPFQDFPYQSAADLAQALQRSGVATAWVSALEAILAPDPAIPEAVLFPQLARLPGMRLVKTVNPTLIGEVHRLVAAHRDYDLAAAKIYPSYHQTPLSHPAYGELVRQCVALSLPLLIVVRINDERNQSPLMQVAPVPVADLITFSRQHADCRIVALNADKLEVMELAEGPENLFFDLAYLDGGSTLEKIVEQGAGDRMLYGSNAPFFYPEAAALKLQCSALPSGLLERVNRSDPF